MLALCCITIGFGVKFLLFSFSIFKIARCLYFMIARFFMSFLYHVDAVFAQESPRIVATFPLLSENVLAIGYFGLQLTTQIEQSNGCEICRWNYKGIIPCNIKTVAAPYRNCSEIYGIENVSLVCIDEDRITTSFIIRFPIRNPMHV